MNVTRFLSLIDPLHGHVDDFSFAVARQNEHGFVRAASTGIGLANQIVVDIVDRTEFAHLPALETHGRRFENPFGSGAGLDDCAVRTSDDQAFVHASHALPGFLN